MADQSIKPVSPVNRTQDVLKRKKKEEKATPPKPSHAPDQKQEKKGIIDTYA